MGDTDGTRTLLSVDLGSVAGPAVDALSAKHKISKSEVVRRAILITHYGDLIAKWDRISTRMVEEPRVKRGPQKQTDEERHVIATYRKTYNYTGRLHHAAALACIRSLVKQGFTLAEVASIVEISKQDVWLANRVARGEHVPLNEILTDKMVTRIMPLLENTEQAELEHEALRLAGTVKPKAFAYLQSKLPAESLSAAWDDIQAATSNAEVEDVIKQYTEAGSDK
jgi:hypothetical protein